VSKQGNLSNEQYQERVRQANKQRDRQRDDDLRELMKQAWGRRLVYWLVFGDPSTERPKEFVGRLNTSVFDSGIKDGLSCAILAARIDGARMFAMEFHNDLERVAPSALVTMLEEQLHDRVVALALQPSGDQHDG